MSKTYLPKDPTGLAKTVVVVLCVYLVGSLLGLVSTWLELQELRALDASAPATFWSYSPASPGLALLISLNGMLQFVIFAVTGFFVLKWVYRSSRNAHALTTGLTVSPRWAVGWFFIPIAWLWKPFKAVEEAWRVAVDPDHWPAEPTPALLRWWWGLWLATCLVGNIGMRIGMSAKDAGGLAISDTLDLVSSAIQIPLGVVLIMMVQRLSDMQANQIRGRAFD